MSQDPYEVLGVSKTASQDEIKKAYRRIVREHHPDVNPDDTAAEERFKAASAAYDLLKDPETRARFDRGEIDASGAERPEYHFYKNYSSRSENPYQAQQGFGVEDDLSDIFEQFLRGRRGFGQRGGAGQRHYEFSARGQDMRYSLEIDFMDAVKGARKQITLPTGERLNVTIPRGTADGQTLRLRGKGGPGFGGGPAGDALVTISVRPHRLFRREGDDILMTLPITIDEAVLGARVEVPTIDGRVHLTIPKGSSSGQVLRLRGRGVHPAGRKTAGDQKVELKIVVPKHPDKELTEFLKGWRQRHAYNPRERMAS